MFILLLWMKRFKIRSAPMTMLMLLMMWCDVMSTIQRVRICKRCTSHPNRWHTFCDNFWLNGCIRSPPLPPIRTTTTATRMHQTCNFRRHNKDCCTLVVPFTYWLYECNSIEIYFYISNCTWNVFVKSISSVS